jgi:5-oxopent-3-ene-1,2,5-tricarboxylate decarboxylase / 2-hydroxyhepta-2,4-diene-1,7-dioate isomerase
MDFEELKKLAGQTSPASVSDIMHNDPHEHYMRGVHCQTKGRKMFGEVVTLRSLPIRVDIATELKEQTGGKRSLYPFERALELTKEDKVLVIDSSGYKFAAVSGDVKLSRLHHLKAEGFVTDGMVRDQEETAHSHYALYCAGFTPVAGTGKFLIGYDLQIPVTCGGVLVRPGDYVIGDASGVVVIPRDRAEDILNKALYKEKIKEFVKKVLAKENVNPGVHYPPTEEIRKRFAEEEGISVDDLPI